MKDKISKEIDELTHELDKVLADYWDKEKEISLERAIEKRTVVLNSITTILSLAIHNTTKKCFYAEQLGMAFTQAVELLFSVEGNKDEVDE